MPSWRLLLGLLALATTGSPALAMDQGACINGRGDAAIPACTALIQSRKLRRQDLVAAYIKRGANLADKADYDAAFADFDKALQLEPSSVLAQADRGLTFDKKGDYDQALAEYEKALRIDPASAVVFGFRGATYRDKGDYDHAIADLSRALTLRPDVGSAYYERGQAYAAKGDTDRAIADLDKTIALTPQDANAWYARGLADDARHDYARAIADYGQVMTLAPSFAGAWNARGWVFYEQGDFDRSITDADQAIALKPDFSNALDTRAAARAGKGDYERAIADLDQAIAIDPKNGTFFAHRGDAYAGKGDKDKALADYRTAAGLVPPGKLAGLGIAGKIAALEHGALPAAKPAEVAAAPKIPAVATLPASVGKRVALVVGVDNYDNVARLEKADGDARAMGEALGRLGFDVRIAIDPDRRTLAEALADLRARARDADTVFLHFSGHGVSLDGENYILPRDVPKPGIDKTLLEDDSFSQTDLVRRLAPERGQRRSLIVVLDACRDNPYADTTRSVGGERGLARVETPKGVFIMYSAGEGQTALDRLAPDDPAPTSVYTRTLIGELSKPGHTLIDIANDTRAAVAELAETAAHEQDPAYYDELDGRRIVLMPAPPAQP